MHFNPRSHKGSDCFNVTSHQAKSKFQSTLPQGERLIAAFTNLSSAEKFQSTLPQGERLHFLTVRKLYFLFQSTLPQGERRIDRFYHWCFHGFQSTLPQGERPQFYTKFHICFISFLPILSPYHISTHSPLPTFNHFLYIFSGANRPEISCLLPFRTKTIFGIL